MSHAPAIAVANVSKSFGGITAVDGVSFVVSGGEVVALAGENGAGKSTIKNIISGRCGPTPARLASAARPPWRGVGAPSFPAWPPCIRRPACS